MIITISPSGPPPTEQIHDQLRGLVRAGQLSAGQPLPSVRQLAADLGVAPGTVAKAYRALETEGIVTTRIGIGTRVSPGIETPPGAVLDTARALVEASIAADVEVDDAVRVLRAVWVERATPKRSV